MKRQQALLLLPFCLWHQECMAFVSNNINDSMSRKTFLKSSYASPAWDISQQHQLALGHSFHFTNASLKPKSTKKVPLLTAEEERECLRQAVELRRLNNLEAEWRKQSPNRELPLLSVRAKASGYGEELDKYEEAKIIGQRARETLITRNMGLVHYCLDNIVSKKNLKLNSLTREDLVQEGAIGLARAVDKWNPSIGGKFSTYAVYWVRATIIRSIAERDDLLRVPVHVSAAIRQINKAAKRLGMDINEEGINMSFATSSVGVTWKDAEAAKVLAEEAGLTDTQFEEALVVRNRRYSGGYVGFDQWMEKGGGMQSSALLASTEPINKGLRAIELDHLRKILGEFLKPKELEAISWRYGLKTITVQNQEYNNNNGSIADEPQTPMKSAQSLLQQAENELFGDDSPNLVVAGVPVKGKAGEEMSFAEVGKQMKVSAEYVRRLCHAALDKLRAAADDGRLEPALFMM